MKNIFYYITILLLLSSCYPTDISISTGESEPEPRPKLPEITQSGKMTFGCLINSLVWRNYIMPGIWFFSSSTSVDSEYFKYNDSCTINAIWQSKDRNKSDVIRINFKGLTTKNKIQISSAKYVSTDFNGSTIHQFAILDTSSTENNITISSLDRNQFILAGEFNLDLKSTISGKVINLRKGRFDSFCYFW